MKKLTGKVAAVTGAASGIGQMLAVNLAAQGCTVAISDIDEFRLQHTAAMLKDQNRNASIHIVNVSIKEQMEQYADEIVQQHGRVDIVINNAGVLLAQSIEDVSYEDFGWQMDINFWGVVYGVKAFLPYLKKQPEGHIVNISSVNGFITWPGHAPYCASKFAIKGFTEALWQEMRHTAIRVSCVHPGGIKTNIVRNARFYQSPDNQISHAQMITAFEKIAGTSADKAARQIIAGIRKDKQRILVGRDAVVLDILTRLFPVRFVRWIAAFVERK